MATDFARTATTLVKDLKTHLEANALDQQGWSGAVGREGGGGFRTEQALPKYKDEEVRKSLREISEHYASLANILNAFREETGGAGWEQRPEVASSVLIHHQSLLRNKRLLLVYTNMRLERIKDFRWKCGRLPQVTQEKLGAPEREFVKSYEKLLAKYQKQAGVQLTVGFTPPSENLIKVRVIEDLGTMEFDYLGEADLQPGTVHLLPFEDAERLIMEGKLEHLVDD
mmetsp:Transcript_1725/g.4911  ORF Transcript_1725/g.4911 Transcript_1725/m.4911 type:complete len:227 (+) Transcript_1725:143-823(+)